MDPKGTENGLLKGPQRGPSKTDFKGLFSEKVCNLASHRVALTFDKDHKAFKKQKQGRPEYLLQRTPPPEKLPLHSLRCPFFTEAAWTL